MRASLFAATILCLGLPAIVHGAPPPPSGPHPRIFLSPSVLAAMKANAGKPGSSMAAVIAACQHAIDKPSDFTGRGYQGDGWSFNASACALAWQVTGNPAFAAAGIKYWRTAMADLDMQGDAKACSSLGVSADQAIASIRRDTNYAIRFIGPHTALAYDWLHDAPGVDEPLRQLSRFCFRNWIEFYTNMGYHRDQPGANYHAGYVSAKVYASIAEAGEDGATSDRFWNETVDVVYGKQIIGVGLAGQDDAFGAPAGVLVGGDWAEGWQYGIMSVEEYATGARALEEQGVKLPEMDKWVNSLALRYFHGLTPARDGSYVNGDYESHQNLYVPTPYPVLGTLLKGTTSDEVAAYAKQALTGRNLGDNVYNALEETRVVAPNDFYAANPVTYYIARGTRTLYARTSWDKSAFWGVFSSAPHLVDDHMHVDAGNFVLSRGADHLIVDTTTYSSRSTLASNAPTLDSDVVLGDYKPSQTGWGQAELTWARGTASGTCAARGDYATAFNFNGTPSDIKYALRDWTFLPEGEIVTIDRAVTKDAAHKMYLRFRSLGTLALGGGGGGPWSAQADVGGSSVMIRAIKLSGGQPTVRTPMRSDNNECFNVSLFGTCDFSRLPVTEYNLLIPGPQPLAIHVIDALGKGEMPAQVGSLNDAPYDAGGQNAGVIGAAIFRASKQTFVVASSAPKGASGAMMTYGVPGANPSRHVVFDAPASPEGKSAVAASVAGDRCVLTITAGGTLLARPLMFSVSTAGDGCKVMDDPAVEAGNFPPGPGLQPDGGTTGPQPDGATMGSQGDLGGTGPGTDLAAGAGTDGGGGCACRMSRAGGSATPALFALAAMIGILLSRGRRRPR